jgi:hypothetical protein
MIKSAKNLPVYPMRFASLEIEELATRALANSLSARAKQDCCSVSHNFRQAFFSRKAYIADLGYLTPTLLLL